MKLSDDQLDESSNKKLAIIFGIITGIVAGILIAFNSDSAYILIAIIAGNAIAFKIDGIHHIITTISFIIVSFLTITILTIFAPTLIPANYLVNFSIMTLLLCTFSAFLDDWGHDNPIFAKNKFTKLFFEHRFAMKLIIFILAIGSIMNFYMGFNIHYVSFLSFSTFIYFILFEIGYFLGGKVFNRFNN